MQELADGNFEVELPGLSRKDEIGAVAQAVGNFKVKAAAKARQEAEIRHQQDQVAAEQRKAEMMKLADAFEGAVGEIVNTVSQASGELEQSATGLASTAVRAETNTTAVAAASGQASSNVQSVATATSTSRNVLIYIDYPNKRSRWSPNRSPNDAQFGAGSGLLSIILRIVIRTSPPSASCCGGLLQPRSSKI